MAYPIPTNTAGVQHLRNGFTQGTYDIWVERNRFNEPKFDGTTDAADFLCMIPAAVDLHDGDYLVAGSTTYEVIAGSTTRLRPGGQQHHTECRLRPALADLRTLLTYTLKDSCTIERRGEPTFNPGDGSLTPGAVTTIYSGDCLVMSRDAYTRETSVVMDATTLMSYAAVIPHTATTVEDDDVFTATATDDPRLQGRPLRVTGVEMQSEVVGRVLFLEDNLS